MMLSSEVCQTCGNNHSGACSAQSIYFYWYPNSYSIPNQVDIVGDWHKWQKHERMIREFSDDGQVYFELALTLSVGAYEYKYLVDGEWNTDPTAPIRQNSYGSQNNYIEILPKKAFMEYIPKQETRITSDIKQEGLKIVGSWDGWTVERPMKRTYNYLKGCEENIIYLHLIPKTTYQFKFKSGMQFFIDEKYTTVGNGLGGFNNFIKIFESRIETPWKQKKPTNKQIHYKSFEWNRINLNQASELPYERVQGHGMCNIGDNIYIFGGKSRNQFVNSLVRINIHNYSLVIEEVRPDSRAFHNMITYGNQIIVYGGLNNVLLEDYHRFNVSEGIWQPSSIITGKKPIPKQKQSCVLYEDLLVFFGGYYSTSDFQYEIFYNDIAVLDIRKMQYINEINVNGVKPKGRFAHTASLIGSDMYVFGGKFNTSENLNLNDIWKINLQNVSKLEWQKIQTQGKQPEARHGHTMNALNNVLIIFGGQNDQKVLLNDVIVFNTNKTEWIYPIIMGEIPRPRVKHASTVIQNDHLVIFGGKPVDQKPNKHFYELRPKEYKPTLDIEQQDD